MRWMISIETLRLTQQIDSSLANLHFNNAQTYVIEEYPLHDSPYGTVVARFRSFATFQNALATNKINPATKWVLYDNEGWNFTPKIEQANPQQYESMFVSLAHQHGYQVILAPAQDLVPAFQHQARAWPDYLAMGLAKVSATGDVYEIQAQPYETETYRGTSDFVDFVHQASSQAHAANPRSEVMAGLSTHRVQDAQQMVDDYKGVKDVVDGYWLNVPNLPPGPRPDLLVGFLRLLDASPGGTCARV